MDLAVGQVYGGKYKIVRLLGQGSMGAVYEGENVRIHRKVAIKTLHQGMAEKGDTLQRFEREAQAAGRIGSKHICEVLDMGDLPDGSRYMVMEHLEGVTLQQHIRSSGRLKPVEASPIIQQLLEGLGAAHTAGIIHRDLKPANVFLLRQPGRPDFVKILDFGVSKFSVLSDEMSMTRTGAVLGTPYYMSPEQAKGARGTDARSDLYAVGVILYECITGQVPFSAETFNELLFRIVLESPPPAESFVPDLPPEFAALIRKAMAREPEARFQTADEFKQALADWSAKAEEEAAPNFDGLATLDHQTVMRTSSPLAALGVPDPLRGPAPQTPGAALRPAPPSTTAHGTVMMEPSGPAAKPTLASQGTVIIDPSVASPPASPAPKPSNGAPARAAAPTQPLPQWTDGAQPAATPQPAGPYAADQRGAFPAPALTPAPAGALAPANGAPSMQPASYSAAPAQPYPPGTPAPPYAAQQPYFEPAASMRAPQPRSGIRTVAFLGIAAGLLAGIAAWAVLWRHTETPSDAADPNTSTLAAPTATAAPSPSADPSSPSPAATDAPSASATTSASASPSATDAAPSAAPPPEDPAHSATAPAASPTSKPSGKPLASATSAPSGKPAASASPSGKGTGTNPSGKRTVSQDL